jgi:hypothetical protein
MRRKYQRPLPAPNDRPCQDTPAAMAHDHAKEGFLRFLRFFNLLRGRLDEIHRLKFAAASAANLAVLPFTNLMHALLTPASRNAPPWLAGSAAFAPSGGCLFPIAQTARMRPRRQLPSWAMKGLSSEGPTNCLESFLSTSFIFDKSPNRRRKPVPPSPSDTVPSVLGEKSMDTT